MQYTLRDIPPHLDVELRERARRERKSLNQVAIEAMANGLGIAGTWKKDSAVEKALAEQDRVDSKMRK